MRRFLILPLVLGLGLTCAGSGDGPPSKAIDEWPSYGHDPGGARFSQAAEITRDNVARLKIAWQFHTGDVSDGKGPSTRSGFETTPLVVNGTLFLTTGFNRVIALDPETGARRWTFDPKIDRTLDYGDGLVNRGVAFRAESERTRTPSACRTTVFEATLDARLIALDAATGMPCPRFGRNGEVSLREVDAYGPGRYHMTSPPAVIDDLVVVGSAINDNSRALEASGVVRAFDARTGALRWKWDPIPPGTKSGAANAWSIIAVDPERHLVFVPTGSASPDHFGGLRPGDDKWADSIVALRAQTGQVAWAFQLVHHDLWDYDSASPPLLASIRRNGRTIPVVIQGNKTGFLYVLNRDTGVPVFPVEERRVPASDVEGESASPTQPVPSAPPALASQRLTADEAWGATPADRDACRAMLRALRNEGLFTPPSTRGTLMMPGTLGGMNWSGTAFDAQTGLLVANTNNFPQKVALIPRARFLDEKARHPEEGDFETQRDAPYGMVRRFLQAPSGLPCNPPPWGLLTAVDVAAGTIRWRVPLGSMQDFGGAHPRIPAGSISLGGPIVTAGKLIFVAGAVDAFMRAFDVETGRELWKAPLPAGGHATPITYRLRPGGKQFVVIAAGGHAKIAEESLSDTLVAFALP